MYIQWNLQTTRFINQKVLQVEVATALPFDLSRKCPWLSTNGQVTNHEKSPSFLQIYNISWKIQSKIPLKFISRAKKSPNFHGLPSFPTLSDPFGKYLQFDIFQPCLLVDGFRWGRTPPNKPEVLTSWCLDIYGKYVGIQSKWFG